MLLRTGTDPAAAGALLEDLADRALRSEFEPVLCLEAPEAVQAPRSLLRADGRRSTTGTGECDTPCVLARFANG